MLTALQDFPLSRVLTILALSTAVSIVAYWVAWIVYARFFHPLSKFPGPFFASISRAWIVKKTLDGDMEYTQRSLHKKHGSLVRIAPDELACADVEAIKLIYPTSRPLTKTDFYPGWRNPSFTPTPDNFTNTDEKLHSERRRIVSHVYSMSSVLQSEPFIDDCTRLFMKRLQEFADRDQSFDLGEWLQWYAFDVVGEIFFGHMFGFMEKSEDHEAYIASLEVMIPALMTAAISPMHWRSWIMSSNMLRPAAQTAMRSIGHIGEAAIAGVAERRQKLMSAGGEASRPDILGKLLEIQNEKGDKINYTVGDIHSETYVSLLAGSDTTAIALRAVLYFLMKQPEDYRRLLVEIDEATAKGELSSPVQYSEAIRLPFLSACIKEAMRLHPSVGLTMPRHLPDEGMMISGQFVPGGTRVGMNACVVQFDEGVFGPDADKFNPSRWLDKQAAAHMNRYLLYFGAGTRTCTGKNIALSELHKLIPELIRRFDVQMDPPDREWKVINHWFLQQKGLIVRLKPRG